MLLLIHYDGRILQKVHRESVLEAFVPYVRFHILTRRVQTQHELARDSFIWAVRSTS